MYATLARCKYVDSGRCVIAEFSDLNKRYREVIQHASAGSTSPVLGSNDFQEQIKSVEMQLTWMVYIIAALIGGRIVRPYLCIRGEGGNETVDLVFGVWANIISFSLI